jgi:hypothetical protein
MSASGWLKAWKSLFVNIISFFGFQPFARVGIPYPVWMCAVLLIILGLCVWSYLFGPIAEPPDLCP